MDLAPASQLFPWVLQAAPPKGVGAEAMQGGEEIPAGDEMKGEASGAALGVPPLTV